MMLKGTVSQCFTSQQSHLGLIQSSLVFRERSCLRQNCWSGGEQHVWHSPAFLQVEAAEGVDAMVEAVGPATVAFAAGGSPMQHVGMLEAAGAYLLHVRLGGAPVSGWPRVLHVLPAPADPAR